MVKTLAPNCCSTCRLDVGCRRRWDCLRAADQSGRTDGRAVRVLARERCLCDLNLDGQGGLTRGSVDGGKRSILQVGVGGIVAGEEAECITAADDRGGSRRKGETKPRSDVGVVGRNVNPGIDPIRVRYQQCVLYVGGVFRI